RHRLDLCRRVLAVERHLLLDHLHLRAARRRPCLSSPWLVRATSLRRVDMQQGLERAIGLLALILAAIGPVIFSTYWISFILTQVFFLGIVAASLIFLSAYGGMVSLAQVSVYGIAGFVLGNATTNGNTKGLNLGWSPWIGIVLGIVIAVAIGLLFGALASRSVGIYFLMITLTYS